MKCYNCGAAMIWGGDFSFEDYSCEGEGIVSNFTCPSCDAYAEFFVPIK